MIFPPVKYHLWKNDVAILDAFFVLYLSMDLPRRAALGTRNVSTILCDRRRDSIGAVAGYGEPESSRYCE